MGNHRDLHVLTHSFPTRRSSDLDWNDIQLSFLGLNGLSEIRNAGVARIRGIELDLGYRQNGFSINAGMSYNDAEIRRDFCAIANDAFDCRSEEHTSELQSLMRISYAVFCLKKKKNNKQQN